MADGKGNRDRARAAQQARRRIELVVAPEDMRDLAPTIHRQRLIVEGLAAEPIDERAIRDYLCELTDVCGMARLIDPVTHRSDQYGWAGWVHWETSGAHFYAWDQPVPFFSVDIYTCKPFEPMRALEFTAEFFDATELVAKGY